MLSKLKKNILAILLFIFFSSLYIYTAAPGVYDGDSGEIAAAVNTLGLSHPTGFPLYMLMGKLFTLLVPIGDVAYRLNIFSALLTSSALVFVFFTLRNLGNSPFASLTASFILGLGRNTIWRNATTTNVYSISLFFATALLLLFSKWKKNPQVKYIYWYGFVWGLSLGTHTTMLAMGIPFLFMLWQARPILKLKVTTFIKIVLATTIPGIQYIYLLFAYKRNGIVTWGSMASWNDFVYYITQRQYAYKMWGRNFSEIATYFKKIVELSTTEFTLIFFCIAIIGSVVLFKKDKFFFMPFIAIALANVVILLGYGKSGSELFILYRYIFLADFVLAIAIASGLDAIADNFEVLKNKKSLIFFMSAILLIISFQFKFAFADNNRRNNYLVEDTARNILKTVEPNSIILAYGDPIIGPLWYLQSIDERKDVIVISSPLVPFQWYDNHLIQKYPDVANKSLLVVDSASRIKVLIENNITTKRPVYAVFNSSADGELEQEFDFIPQGLLSKLTVKDTIDTKEMAIANKEIWQKYTLRNISLNSYTDNELQVMVKTYALALYRAGLSYYYNGMIGDSIDVLQKSVDIFPHPSAQKNLEYIKQKK